VNQLSDYTPPPVGTSPPSQRYDYDADRNISFLTRPAGQFASYNYDSSGRLSTINISEPGVMRTITQNWSPTTGLLATISESLSNSSQAYTYDGTLPTRVDWTGPVSGSLILGYNAEFRQIQEKLVVGSVLDEVFAYDPDGLLVCASASTCSPPGVDALKLNYQINNTLLSSTTLGNVSTTLTYNAYGELASETATLGSNFLMAETYDNGSSWARDKLGRVTHKTELLGSSTFQYDYLYDSAGRLVSVIAQPSAFYNYDGNGNRISAGTYDAQDRLLTYGDFTYTYTDNGERATKTSGSTGQVTRYDYDAFGNLRHVTLPNGNAFDYVIDARGRRIAKKDKNGNYVKRWLYKDDLHPVAELDGSGTLVSRFVFATGKNSPDYMWRGNVTYRILSDQLGSPRLVVNVSATGITGAIAQQMRHDEFGNVLQDTNPGFTPFGFAGGLYDPDTGLVHFGARDYDPVVGRWISKDPLLFGGQQTNLYARLIGSNQ